MGQQRDQRRERVSVVFAEAVLVKLHLFAQLSPDLAKGNLVVGLDEAVQSDHMEIVVVILGHLGEHPVHQRSLAAAPCSNHKH